MGEFLGLGTVELGFAGLGQDLGQGLHHLGGGEGDGQVLELVVVHGHDDKVQIVQLPALHLVEALLGEHLGQLDLPLAPAAAEDGGIAVGNFAHGLAVLHQEHRLQMVVVLSQFVCFLDGFRQLGTAAFHIRHRMYLLIRNYCPSLGAISLSTATWPQAGKMSSSWGKV